MRFSFEDDLCFNIITHILLVHSRIYRNCVEAPSNIRTSVMPIVLRDQLYVEESVIYVLGDQ